MVCTGLLAFEFQDLSLCTGLLAFEFQGLSLCVQRLPVGLSLRIEVE